LEIFAEFVACQESTPSPKKISDKEMEINFTGFMFFLSGFHFQKYCWFFTLYINLKNHVSILGIHILYLKVTIVSIFFFREEVFKKLFVEYMFCEA